MNVFLPLHRHARTHGFTLVEMSVVLVIIALIVGTVLEGASLIHNAQLQGTLNDLTKMGTAYNQFKQLYGGNKPGDFNNMGATTPSATTVQKATDIWGLAGGTAGSASTSSNAACFTAIAVGSQATCDGDGNGYIAGPYTAGALKNQNEIFTAWQQLANAKMIDGSYSGNPTGGAHVSGSNVNVPQGQIDNAAYMFLSQDVIVDAASASNSPYYFYGNYGTLKTLNTDGVTYTIKPGTYLVLGSIGTSVTTNGTSSNLPENELLSPGDAYYLDRKIDDGLPGTGNVMSYFAYPDGTAIGATKCLIVTGGAAAASNTGGVAYNVSVTTPLCNLIYINDIILN